MTYQTKCKGDGIPQHIRRPIPQDILWVVTLEYNRITEYERDETIYVLSPTIEGAERNVIRHLTENGWQYDPDDYFYNLHTQDCVRVDMVQKFKELDILNGNMSAMDLAHYLEMQDFDTFYAVRNA